MCLRAQESKPRGVSFLEGGGGKKSNYNCFGHSLLEGKKRKARPLARRAKASNHHGSGQRRRQKERGGSVCEGGKEVEKKGLYILSTKGGEGERKKLLRREKEEGALNISKKGEVPALVGRAGGKKKKFSRGKKGKNASPIRAARGSSPFSLRRGVVAFKKEKGLGSGGGGGHFLCEMQSRQDFRLGNKKKKEA